MRGPPRLHPSSGASRHLLPQGEKAVTSLLALLRPGETTLLLAVSGGPDSTALLHLCASDRALRERATLAVATVDHRLRPESRAEAEGVAAACAALGIPHAILDGGAPPSTRIEERARAARYAALAVHARDSGAQVIVTAHTLDDQAETILMRLLRGSGPAGLAGMRARSETGGIALLRPLLGTPKAALLRACRDGGWPFALDPMNADERFARVRVRTMLPGLAAEGLTPARLATLARRLAEAEAALDIQAAGATLPLLVAPGVLDAAGWRREPRAVRLRMLARLLDEHGTGPVRLERLERLETKLAGAAAASLPFSATLAGALATCGDGRLAVRPAPPRRAFTFSRPRNAALLGNGAPRA